MKVILTPNPNPPFNLIRTHPAYGGREFRDWSTEQITDHAVQRLRDGGVIGADNVYWVVDEIKLPGGSISEENDYFFDAWEWEE